MIKYTKRFGGAPLGHGNLLTPISRLHLSEMRFSGFKTLRRFLRVSRRSHGSVAGARLVSVKKSAVLCQINSISKYSKGQSIKSWQSYSIFLDLFIKQSL